MSLSAQIGVRLGGFELAVELEMVPGEVVALLGPNGAGKSTALRCLAGLLPIETGRIELDGTVMDDPDRGLFVTAERRSIGVVFQDYLLFAHLSVRENVAFGLRAQGLHAAEARRRADEWLERMGLAGFGPRRPRELSGGQAQRVALARALATEPRLLLLDEPLAALDAGTRSEVRRDIRQHLSTFAGMRVLVTHDPVDAFSLADRVVVVESGRMVQAGTLLEVTAHPRSHYVAELVGVNLIPGRGIDGGFVTDGGTVVVSADRSPTGPAFAAVHPHAIALHRRPPEGSPRNSWQCTVVDVDHRADRVRVQLAGPIALVAEITPAALVSLDVRPGEQVWAAVKATEVTVYPI